MCGRDEFGVTGTLGVKGLAAGFKVYFFGACCLSIASDSLLFVICYKKNEKYYLDASLSDKLLSILYYFWKYQPIEE